VDNLAERRLTEAGAFLQFLGSPDARAAASAESNEAERNRIVTEDS
jgi:hypothetical protein